MKMNLTLEMIRTSRTTKLISLRRAAHLMNVGERERGAVEEKGVHVYMHACMHACVRTHAQASARM